MSNNASRTSRAARDSQRPVPGLDVEPLAHVLLALAISAASLLLAYWTLWPTASAPPLPGGEVLAAEVRQPLPADAETPTTDAPPSARAGRRPAAELAAEEPPAPVTLRGRAVDEWALPVAQAEIWVDDGGWSLATHSDHAGAFELVDADGAWRDRLARGEALRLGARAAGHGPSLVRELRSLETEDVTLVLRGDGAALRIVVQTLDGRAVAGARLELGAPRSADGAPYAVLTGSSDRRSPTPPPTLVTDDHGVALFEGLEPGVRSLSLEHEGHSPCAGLVELREGELTEKLVRLHQTARLAGRVLRVDGGATDGVEVTATAPGSVTTFAASCDADGGFELAELPAGEVRLVAETRGTGPLLRAEATLHLRAGEVATWDPTLEPVDVLRGRLTDAGGAPLAGWRVELTGSTDDPAQKRTTTTDADGRYELPRVLTFDTTRLALFHPQVRHGIPTRVVARPLDEGAADVQLDEGQENVSWAFGRVVRHDGAAAAAQPIIVQRLADRFSVVAMLGDDGSFSTPPLPPGEYVAIVPEHGRGWTTDAAWSIDGRLPHDAGVLLLPELGELALLTSVDDRNAETCTVRVDLLRPGISSTFALPTMIGAVEAPLLLGLAPGTYRLSFPDEPTLGSLEFAIESGETTPVVLPTSE